MDPDIFIGSNMGNERSEQNSPQVRWGGKTLGISPI